jgi:hypothetical protein
LPLFFSLFWRIRDLPHLSQAAQCTSESEP